MHVHSFSHVGITVSDFRRAVRFYWDLFGCPLIAVVDAPPERVRSVFGVDAPSPRCKIGLLRVPGGAVLEIFGFDPQHAPSPLVWNRPGVTHIAFNVTGVDDWHARLSQSGVACLSAPQTTPRGRFFYIKDFDGNLIELIDIGRTYRLLNNLIPAAGWRRRRDRYRQYYPSATEPVT